MGIAIGVLVLCGIKYLHIVFYSQEKWFHMVILAMVAFGGVQIHQFILSQRQIDSKIDSLRSRSTKNNSQSGERQLITAVS